MDREHLGLCGRLSVNIIGEGIERQGLNNQQRAGIEVPMCALSAVVEVLTHHSLQLTVYYYKDAGSGGLATLQNRVKERLRTLIKEGRFAPAVPHTAKVTIDCTNLH